jgi:uncharacterized protein (DUF433 family)
MEGTAMSLSLTPTTPPLRIEESGAVRVGDTRVLLELVIHAFQDGLTPEQIVQDYDTLNLADVYAVIAYYLAHRQEFDEYLKEGERKAEAGRRESLRRHPELAGIRERLLARRRAQSK